MPGKRNEFLSQLLAALAPEDQFDKCFASPNVAEFGMTVTPCP